MTRTSLLFAAAALACLMHAMPANAAANRTFVSALGNDANTCSISQPCRTLQAAYNATVAGGEIDVLDPTGYGSLAITHSILIEGHGWASLNPNGSGNAITINAGASDTVTLRGLIVDGNGIGNNGIVISTAGPVTIEHCVVRKFAGFGILQVSIGSSLLVSNSLFTDNSAGGMFLQAEGTTAITHVAISHVEMNNNGAGISATVGNLVAPGSLLVSVSDSNIAGSAGLGISVHNADGGGVAEVLIARSSVVAGGTGIGVSGPSAFARLNGSTIAHNATGWTASGGGQVTSWGNNALDDPPGNGDTAPSTMALK